MHDKISQQEKWEQEKTELLRGFAHPGHTWKIKFMADDKYNVHSVSGSIRRPSGRPTELPYIY